MLIDVALPYADGCLKSFIRNNLGDSSGVTLFCRILKCDSWNGYFVFLKHFFEICVIFIIKFRVVI